MNENKAIFETMPVPKALATLAIPAIVSQLITMVYNLADTFFLGQTDDPLKVAAASLAYSLFFILNALSNLFGIGGSSLMSRLLGASQYEDAKCVCALSFCGALVVSSLYSITCLIFLSPILKFLGASKETFDYAASYVKWVIVIGGLPVTLSITMAQLLRCEGYSKKAGFGLGLGGLLNIVLDPIFMFVLLPSGLEVTGAAIATCLSNTIALIYFIFTFLSIEKSTCLTISPRKAKVGLKYLHGILSVGLPSALGSLLASISNIIINHLISGYGDIPVAAIGIVKKIDMLPMNVGMGICQGMMPLVAYNYASCNYKRMNAVKNYTVLCGMGFALICVFAFELFSKDILSIFINESVTRSLGSSFLCICCLAVPFTFYNFQMQYLFQAMGKGRQSLILTLCRQGIVNIPLLYILNMLFGMYGIVWTQLIADVITMIISSTLYSRMYKTIVGS